MKRRTAARALATIFVLCTAAGATAQTIGACQVPETSGISERDRARMASMEWARTRGLAAALNGADAADRAQLSALYEPGAVETTSLPEGRYRCRTIKLGGITDLTIYGYFACNIDIVGGELEITKVSGSQQFRGTLTASGTGLFYQGALNYADEDAVAYSGASERDQVGCLTRVAGPEEIYILELPSPFLESFHDVIELRPE